MHRPNRRSRRLPALAVLAGAASLALTPAARSADYTWTGGAGSGASFWDLAANWSPGLPVGTDARLLLGTHDTTLRSGTFDVGALDGGGALTVSGGDLRLNGGASAVRSLRLSGGRIVSPGTLTVQDFHWSAGEFSPDAFGDPPSRLVVTGAATLGNGGGKYMGYGSTLALQGGTRWQDGSSQLTIDGNLELGAEARFYDLAHSGNHSLHLGGAFSNAGLYVKTGRGATHFSLPYGGGGFDNTGRFLVREGTVDVIGSPAGTWRNAGRIEVSRGAALNVSVFRYPAIEQSGVVLVAGDASFSVVWSGMHSTGGWYVGRGASLTFVNDRFDEFQSAEIVFDTGRVRNDGRLVLDGGVTRFINGVGLIGTGTLELTRAAELVSSSAIEAGALRADTESTINDFPIWGSVSAPEIRVTTLDWGVADLKVPGRLRVAGNATLRGGPVYFSGNAEDPAQPAYRKVVDGWLSLGGHTTWTGETDLVGSGRISTVARRVFTDATADELPTGPDDTRPVRLGVARFDNGGLYLKTGAGAVEATGAFHNTGTVRTQGSGRMIFSGSLDNRGVLHAQGGRIDVRGSLAQWSAADRRLTGGRYIAERNAIAIDLGSEAGIARNSARIELRGASAALLNSHGGVDRNALAGLSANDGSLRLLSGAHLTTTAGLANRGGILIGAGSVLEVGGLYRQSGNGQTWIDGLLDASRIEFAGGLWGAGSNGSIGTATLAGSEVRLNAGRLDVDIAATSLYDRVSIDGAALLGGTLFADFAPTDAAEGLYRVLTASDGLSGSFTVLTNLDPALYSVQAIYGANQVELEVTRVSALMATAAALPLATPVPEPETYALMLGGLALLAWQRRRQLRQRG